MTMYYSTPRILTDELYVRYGGRTGTSTALQREAAYTIAEDRMERHIGTFLTPTTVTGTYPITTESRLLLHHNRVLKVNSVTILRTPLDSNSQDYVRRDGVGRAISLDLGLIELFEKSTQDVTSIAPGVAQQAEVSYTAGLAEGVASGTPYMVHALTIVAEEDLMQIIDPARSEGGAGAPGVQQFSMGRYSESRPKLLKTALGSTARAQFAASLVRRFVKGRARRLGA